MPSPVVDTADRNARLTSASDLSPPCRHWKPISTKKKTQCAWALYKISVMYNSAKSYLALSSSSSSSSSSSLAVSFRIFDPTMQADGSHYVRFLIRSKVTDKTQWEHVLTRCLGVHRDQWDDAETPGSSFRWHLPRNNQTATSVDIENAIQKITQSESHATRAQWVCSRAEYSAI